MFGLASRDRVIKQFCKKPVEQLGVIKELNSLVVLSGELRSFQSSEN